MLWILAKNSAGAAAKAGGWNHAPAAEAESIHPPFFPFLGECPLNWRTFHPSAVMLLTRSRRERREREVID